MSSALLDALKADFETLPPELMNGHGIGPLRRSALVSALHEGLPAQRVEAWKYTSLRALAARSLHVSNEATALDPALLADIPAPRRVFVTGVLAAHLPPLHNSKPRTAGKR